MLAELARCPPSLGRTCWRRRWWLVFQTMGVLMGVGLTAAVLGWDFEFPGGGIKDHFVDKCVLAGRDVGVNLSAKQCHCAWEELRDHYDVDEIAAWMNGRSNDQGVTREFARAMLSCSRDMAGVPGHIPGPYLPGLL